MGVKIIDGIPENVNMPKFDILAIDLQEILNEEIEFSELTDFPYSDKTSVAQITRDSTRVFIKRFYELTKKRIYSRDVPFFIRRAKQPDGTCKYYAYFNVKKWRTMLQECGKNT